MPYHAGAKAREAFRAGNVLSAELRRETTDEEVAHRLGWTPQELREVLDIPPDATSLDRHVGEGDSELGDIVRDERGENDVAGAVLREIEASHVREAVARLPERVRHVLVRRYDLDGRGAATLAELATKLGVSREQVRRLQHEAKQMPESGDTWSDFSRGPGTTAQPRSLRLRPGDKKAPGVSLVSWRFEKKGGRDTADRVGFGLLRARVLAA